MGFRRATPSRRAAKEKGEKKEVVQSAWARTWLNEVLAVGACSIAVFLALSISSQLVQMAQAPRENLMGPAGHLSAVLLTGFFGWSSLLLIFVLVWFSLYLWKLDHHTSESSGSVWGIFGLAGVIASFSVICAIYFSRQGGGQIGQFAALPLIHVFGRGGATLMATALLTLFASLTFKTSSLNILKHAAAIVIVAVGFLCKIPTFLFALGQSASKRWRQFVAWFLGEPFVDVAPAEPVPMPKPRLRRNKAEEAPAQDPSEDANELVDEEGNDITHVVVSRRIAPQGSKRREFARVLQPEEAKKPAEGQPVEDEDPYKAYKLPKLSLLTAGEPVTSVEDDGELIAISRQIEAKLKDFGILGKVTEVHPGPVITLFEFEPAPGVKVGRIAALSDDLAMALKASSIRIVAPIPQKGTVGIEIPNKHRDVVRLRDVLESDAFVNADSFLSIPIGKDTYGDPVVVDLAAMPHLLIAGSTGTGKSVCINAILLSLLYRASPKELGLIMIDPKILELSVYEGIPHLRVPVVTQPRQAKAVLQWAVDEMHRRYRYIQKYGVRNIDGYNKIVAGEDPDPTQKRTLKDDVVILPGEAVIQEGTAAIVSPDGPNGAVPPLVAEKLQPLPKIIIVIDEVADLMLSVGREIEELITRLAQKARAAGIHLIIATQRPSVDVITGLIKANFPARLSFRVSSRIDSRTILDSMGAEKLLGKGDMLLMMPGAQSLRRMHGAFVSDNEVKRVVAEVKDQAMPRYDQQIMKFCEKALEESKNEEGGEGGEGQVEEYDSMYDKAVELVVEKGYASTSMIQRVFRIGYNRAARIVELMEKEGVVGPMDGAKPREVLVQKPVE